MRIKFQPMPWLTFFTLICLAILISLGTWQYQRLQWKTNLLVQIDIAANAAPISSFGQLRDLYEADEPLDFRRIGIRGEYIEPSVNQGEPFHLMMSSGKSMFWRLFQPFQTGDGTVFIATSRFPNDQKLYPPKPETGVENVVGYARLVRKASSMQPRSNPDKNNWYVLNGAPELLDWSTSVAGATMPTGYYIDQVTDVGSAADLPVKKPEIRNHHLDYMLTWYSFALILLVIYFILHKRQGRLQFGTKNA